MQACCMYMYVVKYTYTLDALAVVVLGGLSIVSQNYNFAWVSMEKFQPQNDGKSDTILGTRWGENFCPHSTFFAMVNQLVCEVWF